MKNQEHQSSMIIEYFLQTVHNISKEYGFPATSS